MIDRRLQRHALETTRLALNLARECANPLDDERLKNAIEQARTRRTVAERLATQRVCDHHRMAKGRP